MCLTNRNPVWLVALLTMLFGVRSQAAAPSASDADTPQSSNGKIIAGAHLESFKDEVIKSLSLEIVTNSKFLDGITDVPEAFSPDIFATSISGGITAKVLSAVKIDKIQKYVLPKLQLARDKLRDKEADSDRVWIELGPHAWNLGRDFGRGSLRKCDLDLNGLPTLRVRDLIEVSVEKDGLYGYTDGPDSFFEIEGFSIWDPNPAGMIRFFKEQASIAAYSVIQAQAAVDTLSRQIQSVGREISSAESQISSAAQAVIDAQASIDSLNAPVVAAQRALEEARKVYDGISDTIPDPTAIVGHWLHIHIPQIPNPAKAAAKIAVDNATTALQKVNAKVDPVQIAKFTAARSHALELKAAQLSIKASADLRKKALEIALKNAQLPLDASRKASENVAAALDSMERLAGSLPDPAKEGPKPGEWNPHSVKLTINGHIVVGPLTIDRRLRRYSSFWTEFLYPEMKAPEKFYKGLRVQAPAASSGSEQAIALITTVFKLGDVSGWHDYPEIPVKNGKVVGILVNPPSPGWDWYESLDLAVESASADGMAPVLIDASHGFDVKRFVRVEMMRVAKNGHVDMHSFTQNWKPGNRFEVVGRIRRDTDKGGFYEIHPASTRDVKLIQ